VAIGLKLFGQGRALDEQRTVWRVADEGGFDHCWVSDHLAGIDGDRDADVFEAWSLLSALAVSTERVRIGCLVTANTFRHPGVLAKMAVTVDRLSGGRLELGLGAAWSEDEHAMLGIAFGTAGERVERLAEACQILKMLWTTDLTTFSGRHYELRDAVCNPKPAQRPHPPIWIGGSGERKTLRVVAEHADVWNVPATGPHEFGRLSLVLDEHCRAIGRNPASIRRSIQLRFDAGPRDAVAATRAYAAIGIDDVVLVLMGADVAHQAEQAAEALPQLREELGE
jgi:F420-dependent oxidoreductase-like protein